ncbi:hypothetical protein B296_00031583 [Ensete ventricosum]|uniref:Uncharacterized protein n=1 Tax=Ensete ventricosum TaxID=4639 RepID=A0A426YQ17_ENSVE|nr:hypothetical protein B296_00031583 [Ensete ventricosum]
MTPCLLSKHCWFRPVCASSPAVVSVQSWSSGRGKGPRVRLKRSVVRVVGLRSGGNASARVDRWFLQEVQVESGPDVTPLTVKGFYSNGYGASVPEVLTTPVAYHVVVLRRSFCGPRGEVCGVPPATGEGRSCPLYLCRVDRMMANPPMLVSGRAQSHRVGHVVGLAVRGCRDVAVRSTFVISFPLSREDLLEAPNLGAEDEVLVISGVNSGDLAEKVTSGTNLGDLTEQPISGTNLKDSTEELISSTNPEDLTERVNSGTNLRDLAEEPISGTNPRDFTEGLISGTNPRDFAEGLISGTNTRDLAEKVTSGTNHRDLVEEPISGTNHGDFVEGLISGTNPGDLAEASISDTNLGDLTEKVISGTNPGDLAERVVSGTNPGDLAEGLISGTNLGDLVEEPISNTNLGDLAEKVISGTNPRDLAERVVSGTNLRDLVEGLLVGMTSSDSSSSVRVISSLGSRGVSQSDPEASSSGASSGPLLSVDSRALRDLEVMKADHDLDTTVTEGSIVVIRERYNIQAEYGLYVSQPGQRPFSSDAPDRMDLGELHEMPKVSGDKTPSTRTVAPTREVVTSPTRETQKASSKRPIDASTEQVDDPARRPKKVKVLTRRHKSRHGKGETHSRSKDKEPAAPSEEFETPVEYDEGGASSVHHRPRSMKDLFKTKVHKDDAGYYTLHMSDLGHQDPDKEMKARWRGLKNSTKIWNDSSAAEEFERGLLHPQLARELYTLPSEVLLARPAKEMVLLDVLNFGGGPEAVAKAEERASELEQELGKTKQEQNEVLQWLEASKKELTEVRSNLVEIQRLLKEARVRARKMDDELLQSVKALESARAELPKQAIDHYKESAGFKEGLKRMGRVTYEYGYQVTLARFRALHPDSKVEQDPSPSIPKTIWCR